MVIPIYRDETRIAQLLARAREANDCASIEWAPGRKDHAARLILEEAITDAIRFVNALQAEEGAPLITGMTAGSNCRLAKTLLKRLRAAGLVGS